MENIQKDAGRVRPKRHTLDVGLARSPSEILDAQRLRYRVFAGEMGANLPSRTPGVDHDIYDPYCDHLVVRDTQSGEVVGTYRILSPENARQIGYYSENEFDLTRLQHLRSRLGRNRSFLCSSGLPYRCNDHAALVRPGPVHDRAWLRLPDGLRIDQHG